MDASFTIETRSLSSLVKVFPDTELKVERFGSASALQGEVYSFQIAYRAPSLKRPVWVKVRAVCGELGTGSSLTVKSVGLAPSSLPAYGDPDGNVLRGQPGLFPDPLMPLGTDGLLKVLPNQWRSLWIEVAAADPIQPGIYRIEVEFCSEEEELIGRETFDLEILSAQLPDQELLHTEWFHADCLATEYGVDILGERHWELIETYIQTASRHGINMILTPLFTPPLDTAIGGERPTVQLVEVVKEGEVYTFDFNKLTRWIEVCKRQGIRYIEFSHLFTQWGAKHAPKIEVLENGVRSKHFGWHTDAAGEAYGGFLDQFLPSLTAYIRANRLEDCVYFHVSDEPHEEHVESYRIAAERMRRHIDRFPVIDALSDIEFFGKGLVRQPIPANDRIEPFLEAGVPELWTYYCCSQYKEVANRFFDMPSARSRILGVQLYKFGIKGFLHWGYNFWYSQYSVKAINPFEVTDADGAFPSGDPFLVYPGKEGPIESIRLKVVREAIQDVRALRLLESISSREETLQLLEEDLDEPLTFRTYPQQEDWLLSMRQRINGAIRERLEVC